MSRAEERDGVTAEVNMSAERRPGAGARHVRAAALRIGQRRSVEQREAIGISDTEFDI